MTLPQYTVLADSRVRNQTPLFSVIVAVYNVEEYIEQTLKSFRRQNISTDLVEYILVDDGSSDNSAAIAQRFAATHPNVLVLTKPNSGVGETRKVALANARGTWVTAVDPDDLIEASYFSEAKRFADNDYENKVAIMSSRVLITNGSTGEFRDTHPLGAKFRRGNRVVSMLEEPEAIQMGATVFMRLAVLREHNLTYDERIEPTFEDGNLVCRYLAHFENPSVALLSTSHYYYRKRADNSSLVQSSWLKPARYSVVPKLGYLAAMNYMLEKRGSIPQWLANVVLYDLMWYFKEDEKMGSAVAAISSELKEEFMEVAREIFSHLSVENILRMPVNKPGWRLRESLISGFRMDKAPARIFKWSLRPDNTRNYSMVLTPGEHEVTIYSAGEPIEVVPEGITNRLYFDEVMAVEYTLNLPEAPTMFLVDGIPCAPTQKAAKPEELESDYYLKSLTQRIRNTQPRASRSAKVMNRIRTQSGIQNRSLTSVVLNKVVDRAKTTFGDTMTDEDFITQAQVEQALLTGAAQKFKDAWLILDHADRADDNGEHLYRHILNNYPEINAYFLLGKESKDWQRLEDEGFRLVEFGSIEAMAAARMAAIVASSDAVEECIYPAPRRIFGAPDYKFVFLQHGITKDDLSRWLNGKKIDLIIAATKPEYQAFTLVDSPYEYKYHQVALTGFARYDNLHKMVGERTDRTDSVRTLFIMPTWRQDLRDELAECTSEAAEITVLKNSEFYKNWWGFLQNPALAEEIKYGRLKVRMMTHPSFGDKLSKLPQPAGVDFLLPSEHSFQELMNEADIFLTDYSSLAFDIGFMGTPVAYFQFDRERMLSGAHTYRKGYFDYYDDGLGPIIREGEELQSWVDATLKNGCSMEEEYMRRRRDTFAYLDGNSSERIYQAMKSMVDGTWPQSHEGHLTARDGKL